MRFALAIYLLLASALCFGAGYYNTMFSKGSGATPFTWTGKGGDANFSTPGNWYGGVAPGLTNTAVFDGKFCATNCNVTINVNVNIQGLIIRSSYPGTITQTATRSISVGSKGWDQAGGTFIGSSSGDSLTFIQFKLSGGSFTATSGVMNVQDHFTILNSPTYNHNSGTLTFKNDGTTRTITGNSVVVNHLNFEGGPYDETIVVGTINVDGNLTTSNSDARTYLNGGTIAVKGDVTFNNYGLRGSTIIDLIGSSNQTISGTPGTPSLPGIKVSSSGGTVNFANGFIIANSFTYTSGTVVMNAPVMKFIGASTLTPGPIVFNDVEFLNGPYNYMTLVGTMLVNEDLIFTFSDGRASISGGTIEVRGNLISNNNTNVGDTTVILKGSANQTISGTGEAILPNLTIASTGGTVSFLNSYRVLGNFTYTSGVVDAGTSTVSFHSSAITPGSINFYNVSFVNGAYTYTALTGSLNVTNDLQYSSGDGRSSINGGTIYVGRNITYTTSMNSTSSSWVLNGPGTQTISIIGSATSGNITVNNPASVVTLATNLNITGSGQTLTLSAGSFNMAGRSLSTRALSLNGNTLTKAGGTLTVNGTTVGDGAGLYGGTVAP